MYTDQVHRGGGGPGPGSERLEQPRGGEGASGLTGRRVAAVWNGGSRQQWELGVWDGVQGDDQGFGLSYQEFVNILLK